MSWFVSFHHRSWLIDFVFSTCSCRMCLNFCFIFHWRVNFWAYSCNFSGHFWLIFIIWLLNEIFLISMEVECFQYWCWLVFWFHLCYLLWRSWMNCADVFLIVWLHFCIKFNLWNTSDTVLILLSDLHGMEIESIQDRSWLEFIRFFRHFFGWSSVDGGRIVVFVLLQFGVKLDWG